jgi:flagellar hook protein FlgE
MMRGMNAAISGLEASQTWLDTTANNLANANTIGYKAQSTTFEDELSQTLSGANAPGPGTGGSNAQQVGLGVQVGSIDNLMGQGSAQTTGNPLDVSIQGDGFFVVNNGPAAGQPDPANPTTGTQPAASNDYTRAGNLTTNSNGVLTTQSGQYVMGYAPNTTGGPTTTPSYLVIPSGGTNVAIGKDGAVTYTDTTGATQTAGYLQVASFPNEAGLTRDGGSMWSRSASSGAPSFGTPGQNGLGSTIAGQLEGSNVDMATEFSNMIQAQTGYQADSKVITTGDQMLQSLVQMVQ